MADDFEKLREEIAREIGRTAQDGESSAYSLRMRLSYDEQLRAADRILAIPAIADVLRMKPIQTMPLREPRE